MESIHGKYFSIRDPQEVNTVVYRINKTEKENLKDYPKYTVERLINSEEIRDEGKVKTFFVDNPNKEGEQLVMLSFGKDKVVVNMGILEDSKVKISKKTLPIKFDTMRFEEETEYKDFKYTPSLKRQISIIDPDTAEEVKPVLYYDEKINDIRGKCTLKPGKSYFAFEINDN